MRELDRPVRLDELQARRRLTNAIKLIIIEMVQKSASNLPLDIVTGWTLACFWSGAGSKTSGVARRNHNK